MQTNKMTLPDNTDLLSQIRFDPAEGKIWLSENRMLLMHSAVMGLLRKDLITTLGEQRTRAFLMRLGYQSGWIDAELVQGIRPDLTTKEAYFVGPQLHTIEGMVRAEPLQLDFDVAAGTFECTVDWHDSYEAALHVQEFGLSENPICWTLLGYASGYTTFYMQQRILFKEVMCSGCGDPHCRIVGKPIDEWEDHVELENMLLPDPVADELFALRQQLSELHQHTDPHRRRQHAETGAMMAVGQSPVFRDILQLLKKAADSKATVLLQGETGVGKEVMARELHAHSQRADKAFVAVNCACIPQELIEAELFGVNKGAFTGANESRAGRFERAHLGTIFLDEVVELSPKAQAALLRVLQEGELERVGGDRAIAVDVRVVAASNENLKQAVDDGRFRADLFYRLNVFTVEVPPLRERREDIALFVDHFVRKYNDLYNKNTLGVSDLAMQHLMHYDWPGNIRELENMMERGVILTDNNHRIELHAFPAPLGEASIGKPSDKVATEVSRAGYLRTADANAPDYKALLGDHFDLRRHEEGIISAALEKTSGNISRAARLLGLTRSQLNYRLKSR
ncbi:sigma-54-dependent Fis family transcriptional regulator [Oceanobacter mangrovi]|uniref:sigma-54-dependent Fis family transcriptional regulator n=1 Tax=Oceanobacter mangrovi TaxID=2862510 RepID=UPI001C8E7D77|nr:sigma-54-dependent Fis family transcriptional regulator [Oceanobacter mangrovi]